MKARIKATGEIIEVSPTYSMKDRSDTTIYYTDGKLGEWTASDLDFLPEKETAVLEGWLCRDKTCNRLWICSVEPQRYSGWWIIDTDEEYIKKELPSYLFPSVTWQSEPKRVKLTIEE